MRPFPTKDSEDGRTADRPFSPILVFYPAYFPTPYKHSQLSNFTAVAANPHDLRSQGEPRSEIRNSIQEREWATAITPFQALCTENCTSLETSIGGMPVSGVLTYHSCRGRAARAALCTRPRV